MEWWAQESSGAWVGAFLRLAHNMNDRRILLEIGFRPDDEPLDQHDAEYATEMQMARTALHFVCNLKYDELSEGRMYSEVPPGVFGALVSSRDGDRQVAMRKLQGAWEVLQRAEANAHEDASLRSFVRDLVWPSQPWVREVMISASENAFRNLPKPCYEEVLPAARAFRTSKPVEDLFNGIRDAERVHKSNKLGRCSRWHKLWQSDVLPDCDRQRAEVSETDRVRAAAAIPTASFEARRNTFSLGAESLESFRTSEGWAAPRPSDWPLVAQATSNTVECDGFFGRLRKSCWRCLWSPGRSFTASVTPASRTLGS